MPVIIKNINQGGIADSDYVGVEGSVAELVNMDIHSESGVMKCNQKLTKDSGSTVTDFVKAQVACSNGSTYHFGDTGKIYEREAAGTWTLRGTASPAAGAAAILSAWEYQGYIYYAMQSRLGRFAVVTAGSAITLSDNFATFTNTDADFHPMMEVNQVLYIGDKHYVAQVDAGTFSANALDIKQPLRISALGKMGTDLLIGTYVAANVVRTEILRWNTWSVSYSVSDTIPEVGVNSFLDGDNLVLVNAGTKGSLYIYDGSTLEPFKTIKGTWSSTNKAKVHANAIFNFNGMPLFGLSQVTGTGVLLGVYSFARTNRNYPYILNLEHAISTGNLTGIEIGAIVGVSADQFAVSWKDTNSGTTYGVDILDLSAKATAYVLTRVMYLDRNLGSEWGYAHAAYRSLPASAQINFYEKKDHGSLSSEIASTDDGERDVVSTDAGIGQASTLQIKTELVPNGNNSPEIEELIFELAVGQ